MGWEEVILGEHIELMGGGTPDKSKSSYWDGDIPWASVKDLKQDSLHRTQDKITEEGLRNSSARIASKGQLIIATRMAVGRIVKSEIDVAINQDLKSIKVSDKIHSQFLFYLLKSKQKYFEGVSSGATVKGIKKEHITKIKIPLPPLPIQKKIAAILDAADDYRQKTKVLLDKYDELTQSIFLEMFGDPVHNQKGFEKTTIRKVVKEVKYGTSSKASESGRYPYLRMNNITYEGHMNYSSLKFIDIEDDKKHKYLTKKGDILFNRTNSKELVGKTGLIDTDEEMILAGYLIRVRLNDDMNPHFLWAHMNSRWAKLTLENMCKNIVGMANINAQELQDIDTLKPPKQLQDKFEQRVQKIEVQKSIIQNSIQNSENLFQSLLQKAFKGELVN